MSSPTFVRTLDELVQFLHTRDLPCRRNPDGALVHGDVHIARQADFFDVAAAIPATLSDLALADANQRLAIPGLHRADDGRIVYVIRIWPNHDGTVDASIFVEAIAATHHALEAVHAG